MHHREIKEEKYVKSMRGIVGPSGMGQVGRAASQKLKSATESSIR